MDVNKSSLLQQILEQKLELVLNGATDEILKEFQKYVVEFVYENHGKPTVYKNPNGREFLENWEWTKLKKSALSMSKEMFFNYEKVSNEPDFFGFYGIHGSMDKNYPGKDTPQYLPEILNRKISSSSPISPQRKGEYWNLFIKDMFAGGRLKKIIDKHAKKHGLQPVSISAKHS